MDVSINIRKVEACACAPRDKDNPSILLLLLFQQQRLLLLKSARSRRPIIGT
jgi:hypothetical protein